MVKALLPTSETEIRNIHNIHIAAMNKPRHCYRYMCQRKAINSHLIQKNGPLQYIAEKGHIRELRWQENTSPIRFAKIGINKTDVLAFLGFCSSCDDRIFKPIESDSLNFSNYQHQLLFCYRAAVCELHKIDSWLATYQTIIDNTSFELSTIEYYKLSHKGFSQRREGALHITHVLGREIDEKLQSGRFLFHVFRLPKLDVACSGVYSFDRVICQSELDNHVGATGAIFVHSIPQETETIFLLGYDRDIKVIQALPVERLIQLCTDQTATAIALLFTLLIKYVESWAISESFYQELKSVELDKLITSEIAYYLHDKHGVKSDPYFIDIIEELETRKRHDAINEVLSLLKTNAISS